MKTLAHVETQVSLQESSGADTIRLSRAQVALLEQVAQALEEPRIQPERMSAPGEVPPPGRLRVIGDSIIEHWEPIPAPIQRGQPFGSGVRTLCYRIRQRKLEIADRFCQCLGTLRVRDGVHDGCGLPVAGRALRGYAAESQDRFPRSFAEHVANLHIAAMSDFDYDGYYPTIPGNDIAHHNPAKAGSADKMEQWRDGSVLRSRADDPRNPQYAGPSQPIRGGTEIRHGRREWREKTKDMRLVDSGYFADVQREARQQREKRLQEHKLRQEQLAKMMPRTTGA